MIEDVTRLYQRRPDDPLPRCAYRHKRQPMRLAATGFKLPVGRIEYWRCTWAPCEVVRAYQVVTWDEPTLPLSEGAP